MKILPKSEFPDTLVVVIDQWPDIDQLKNGNVIAERYDAEHKVNLSVIPETLFVEPWTGDATFAFIPRTMLVQPPGAPKVLLPPQCKFDSYLHDFFVQISAFDVRCGFVKAVNGICEANPYFSKFRVKFAI